MDPKKNQTHRFLLKPMKMNKFINFEKEPKNNLYYEEINVTNIYNKTKSNP